MAKAALGKGLGALIGTSRPAAVPSASSAETVHQIRLTQIVPSRLQPREEFEPDALRELVDSIRAHGIIQPLIVRPSDGRYELIAGERRWRAAQEVGLVEVPALVRNASDRDVLELSLIENLQRADLNPIEEAQAYQRLAEEFGLRQEDIAQKVGRSRAGVANSMRLLDLHPQIQSWVKQDLLSVGHAKVLLALKHPDEQLFIAEAALRRSATVRGVEKLVARQLGRVKTRRRTTGGTNGSAVVQDLQARLQQHLGTHVTLQHGDKRGTIEIEYYGNDDLQRVLGLLGLPLSDS